MPDLRHLAAGVITAALVAALAVVPTSAAWAAGQSTTTVFAGPSSLEVDFGSDWVLPILVTENGTRQPLDTSDGTVDVYVAGQPGIYAAGLPISAGGIAYFAQPSAVPLLGASQHTVTAIFVPAPGSDFDTSQTAAPATLTVSALGVVASSELGLDSAGRLAFDLRLAGAYIDANGQAPTGSWTVTLRRGDTVEFTDDAEQTASAEPITVPVDAELAAGRAYTGTAVFTPDPRFAGGLESQQPADREYRTADDSFGELLTRPIATPVWAIAAAAITLIGALCLLLIGIGLRRRRAAPDPPAVA